MRSLSVTRVLPIWLPKIQACVPDIETITSRDQTGYVSIDFTSKFTHAITRSVLMKRMFCCCGVCEAEICTLGGTLGLTGEYGENVLGLVEDAAREDRYARVMCTTIQGYEEVHKALEKRKWTMLPPHTNRRTNNQIFTWYKDL